MGQELQSHPVTTRTVRLPADDGVSRSSQMYRVHSIRLNGELDVGVTVPPEADGTVDDCPPAVHDVLSDLAEERTDPDRLEAMTTQADWPVIGVMILTRLDPGTVEVSVEWIPP